MKLENKLLNSTLPQIINDVPNAQPITNFNQSISLLNPLIQKSLLDGNSTLEGIQNQKTEQNKSKYLKIIIN